MTSLFVEAVVLVFCVGGILGAIAAMHFSHYRQQQEFDQGELSKIAVQVDRRSRD